MTESTATLTPAQKGAASRKAREAEREAAKAAKAEAFRAAAAERMATWHACPTDGCLSFPFETAEDLAEHQAAGEHCFGWGTATRAQVEAPTELPTGGTGSGHGSTAPQRVASDKALDYLASLLAELANLTDAEHAHDAAAFRSSLGQLTPAACSQAIDTAKDELAKAKATKPAAATSVRPNKFAAKCADCGQQVPAGQGSLTGSRGAWVTRHLDGQCPEQATTQPAGEAPEGFHLLGGAVVKVQRNLAGTGTYAKRLTLPTDDELAADPEARGTWSYAAGLTRQLSADTLMDLDAAKAFGQLYGFCGCCGRRLTDDSEGGSIELGIGPVCRAKFDA